MTDNETNGDLRRLEQALDLYGANLARWPNDERRALEPLIAKSNTARRMVGEARAVDRLLDMAPATVAREDLVNRIVEKAKADRGHSGAKVIRFRPGALAARAGWRANWTWPSAALLAASLLLGLYVGATGLVDPQLTTGFDVASANDPFANAFPELSFEEDITLSEDFL